ncbi:MAG: LacI family transcriptional regulator [Lachnospiraceae bacterium]|nr:LacI family transcriptional regulator [Lachnospiraceae bacterium]
MNKNITIEDIAEELNVSKTTVSRAISGKGRISKATREKVLNYIKESGYHPNIIAKGLAESKTFNICVVLPGDFNLTDLPFFQTVQIGICEYLSEHGYDVILTGISSNLSNLNRIISNKKVDGVILTMVVNNDPAIAFLKSQSVPFVAIGSYPDEDIYQIDANHYGGSYDLTSILLMKGMRKIALLGGNTEHIVTEIRRRGFMDAHQDKEVVFNGELYFRSVLDEEKVKIAVEVCLEKKADCIICMDDNICGIVLRELARQNIAVPQSIKVASLFGSTLFYGRSPGISCLEFDTRELGTLAAKMMLDVLGGAVQVKRNTLAYEVVLKESTN